MSGGLMDPDSDGPFVHPDDDDYDSKVDPNDWGFPVSDDD